MFLNWNQIYLGTFNHKPIFKRIWKEVPKFNCWEIWLAKNKAIFQNILLHHSRVLANLLSMKEARNHVASSPSRFGLCDTRSIGQLTIKQKTILATLKNKAENCIIFPS
jgi:hypothetical protein